MYSCSAGRGLRMRLSFLAIEAIRPRGCIFQPARTYATQVWRRPKSPDDDRKFPEEGGFEFSDANQYYQFEHGETMDNGRYVVDRKLGYGMHGNVWLAEDIRTQDYVAIKVSRCRRDENKLAWKLAAMKSIREASKSSNHPGKDHVVQLERSFKHKNSDEEHLCTIMPVLGPNIRLQARLYDQERIPVTVVKEVSRQLLQGLDFLHSECKVIHGDLKPSDILLELANAKADVQKYIEEIPRNIVETDPELLDFERDCFALLKKEDPDFDISGKHVICSGEGGKMMGSQVLCHEKIPFVVPKVSEMKNFRFRIVDFGFSKTADMSWCGYTVPQLLRPPEIVVGAPWNTSADIFALGCMIWEWVKGHFAFVHEMTETPKTPDDWTTEKEKIRIARMIEVMGRFPKILLERTHPDFDRNELFFESNETGDFLDKNVIPSSIPLETLIGGEEGSLRKPDDMSSEEVLVFSDFLKRMIELDPTGRATAKELLEHPWIKLA